MELAVEDRNLWRASEDTRGSSEGPSYRDELIEEWRWRGFLGTRNPLWMVRQGLRFGRSFLRPRSAGGTEDRLRLLNIEMAHLNLWRRGLDSGASVIIVIEDDADVQDSDDVAAGLEGLLNASWSYVNLSLSFGADDLGVTRLLEACEATWIGSVNRQVLRAKRPVTNTVCALAYRREFLADLLAHWEAMPMEPLLPIDWKMNRALREMVESGVLEADSSLWVEPGPLVQRSLHPNTRS